MNTGQTCLFSQLVPRAMGMAWALWLALSLAGSARVNAANLPPEQVEFFENHIRPVFVEFCYDCHSGRAESAEGGLTLDTRRGLLAGGESGPMIVTGRPATSLLIKALRHAGPEMPPDGRLPDKIVARFEQWIEMGAPDPRVGSASTATDQALTESNIDLQAASEFWSFQPIRDPDIPEVRDTHWPRQSLDYFVRARLDQQGLSPVVPADGRTWIRRVTFDLTGLPPTPEEVDAFLAHQSPAAYEAVVDRLLASPHYGERWARRWMDISRYAEDQAHSFKPRLYPFGYRYRDWLINVFNDDMPYDRFVVEQIAGDLLDEPGRIERLPALGFFALGPVYYGDGKMFDQLDDRVDTFSRGLLGLTVACARCHDHKYDPISTKDYYALAGVFACSDYVQAPLVSEQIVDTYDRAQEDIGKQQKQIDDFTDGHRRRMREEKRDKIARYMLAAWKFEHRGRVDADVSLGVVASDEGVEVGCLKRWSRFLSGDAKEKHAALSRWFELLKTQDANADLSTDPLAIEAVTSAAKAFQQYAGSLLALRDSANAPQADRSKASSGDKNKKSQNGLDDAQAELLGQIFGDQGLFSLSDKRFERLLPVLAKKELASMRNELGRLTDAAPPMYPVAHSLTEGSNIRNLHVNVRGDPESPGPEAPRRFLPILAGANAQPFQRGSGRLELAHAVASPENPLTARVIVNRVWQHLFGRGIVGTPSNFGSLGAPPSHPDLLDHLANRLIDSGWSLKSLQREILLSSTYRLSSELDTKNFESDPDNVWHWRMNRRRLDVEAWRDALLAASGRLDPRIGGPSVELSDPGGRRRTLYAKVSRHDLDPLLRLYDFPDPNITNGRRSVTTVPLQQLFVFNSEFMVRQAKSLAARITTGRDGSQASRVREAFRLVYARPATDTEVQQGLAFLAAAKADRTHGKNESEQLTPWQQYAQVLLSTNEFMFLD